MFKSCLIFVVWCSLLMFVGSQLTGQEETKPTDKFSPFTFSVVGDNQPLGTEVRSEGLIQPSEFKETIREINRLDSDFTILTGDHIYGYEDDEKFIHQEWDEYFKVCRTFKNLFYPVVGNHDVWSKKSEQIWLKRVGPLYYAFSYKGCRFICLSSEDTDKRGSIYEEQLDWLKKELAECKNAQYIFVFLHQPLWDARTYPPGHNNWMTTIHPLLAEYKVNTVFAGHWHRYQLCEPLDGVRYVITGGGGAELGASPLAGGFFHHLFVSVKSDNVNIAVVHLGSIHPEDIVTQSLIQQLDMFNQQLGFPTVRLKLGEATEETANITVHNPFEKDITIDYSLLSHQDSGLVCKEPPQQITLKPGQSDVLSFQVFFDGQNPFPFPQTSLECSMSGKELTRMTGRLSLERIIHITKVVDEIVLDGKLVETSWQKSSAEPWIKYDGSGWTDKPTRWSACYDKKFLYLAFDCQEPQMDQIKQVEKNHDWNSLDDNSVFIYLDPIKDGLSRICFGATVFEVKTDYQSPRGKRNPGWNPTWGVKVSRNRAGFSMEMAIPFDVLNVKTPVAGMEWGMNVFRSAIPGQHEFSGWRLPAGRPSCPTGFGKAVFE